MTRAATLRTVADAGLLIQLQAEAGAAPDWIQILPASPIATRDSRGPYTVRDVEALIRVSMEEAEGRLPIDENHSIDLAGPAGLASPAFGWIVEMQARDGAVWARVEWTEAGRRLVGDRAYRGVSPVFAVTKKGSTEVARLLRVSLTNTPNLRGLAALHHQENDHMEELLQQLAAALGLGEGADRAAIVARATDLNQRPAPAAELQSALTPIAKALGDGVAIEGGAILAAIGDLRDPAKVVSADAVKALQTELATLKAAGAKDKATGVVDAAIAAGKPGVKPLRDHYIARHMADPAAVERELAALPSIAGRVVIPAASSDVQPGTAAALDEVQLQAAKLLGLAPEAYAKTLAAQQEAR